MLTALDTFEVLFYIAFAAIILIGVLKREKLITWEKRHIWNRIERWKR